MPHFLPAQQTGGFPTPIDAIGLFEGDPRLLQQAPHMGESLRREEGKVSIDPSSQFQILGGNQSSQFFINNNESLKEMVAAESLH
mmetsp:Transcript_24286/g.37481  ORF Transcript_24286/g.37481 Transcript_24286/m.37481 type:complete len:85 (-) Transcript_24286:2938-3192(-)